MVAGMLTAILAAAALATFTPTSDNPYFPLPVSYTHLTLPTN